MRPCFHRAWALLPVCALTSVDRPHVLSPLQVVASSLETLSPIILDNFRCDRELGESLKASANVPKIAGPPRKVRHPLRSGLVGRIVSSIITLYVRHWCCLKMKRLPTWPKIAGPPRKVRHPVRSRSSITALCAYT